MWMWLQGALQQKKEQSDDKSIWLILTEKETPHQCPHMIPHPPTKTTKLEYTSSIEQR